MNSTYSLNIRRFSYQRIIYHMIMVVCLCMFISCAKEEDPVDADTSDSTTNSTTNSTTDPTASNSRDGDTIYGPIADIRRGINTQQFFIGKQGNSYNNFPGEMIADSAIDSQGNHILGGGTIRTFNAPYQLEIVVEDGESYNPKPNILVVKVNPKGEFLWAFNLDNYSIQEHLPLSVMNSKPVTPISRLMM